MDVSVVIPAHNEEQYIQKTLQHILDQTEKAQEIIVVNNNSTDKTVSLVQAFPVKLLSESKPGIIPTRNTGFNHATGDIIARTDADTNVPKDWIARIKRHFEDPAVVAVSGPVVYQKKRSIFSPDIFFSAVPSEVVLGHHILFGPNMAIRNSAWKKIAHSVCLDDKNVHEDLDLSIHIGRLGKIIFDPQLVVTTSARRVNKNIASLLFEYPFRWGKTIWRHRDVIRKKDPMHF